MLMTHKYTKRDLVAELPHISVLLPPARRPLCGCCGKPLRPRLWHYRLDRDETPRYGVPCEPIPADALAWGRVKQGMGCMEVTIWQGKYRAIYVDGAPVFCTNECAIRFALAAWRGGQRIKRS